MGFLSACQGPYSGPAEPLKYPKTKDTKQTATGAVACPPEPDTCKTAFDLPPAFPTKSASKVKQSTSMAQDADNRMDGYAAASCVDRHKKAYDAVVTLTDALRADPYNPHATYTLASVYAQAGKKKCALAMITRLKELGNTPELAQQVAELKTRAKTDSAFDAMRKETDGAIDAK